MLATDKCDYELSLCGHSSPVSLPLKVRSHACRKTDWKRCWRAFLCEKFNGKNMECSIIKQEGDMRFKKFTEEQQRQICQEYLGGVSCIIVAKKWKTNPVTVRTLLLHHGHKLRSFSEGAKIRESRHSERALGKLKIIRKVEGLRKKGFPIINTCKDMGIVYSTYHGWKSKYLRKKAGKSDSTTT